jgi:hypothetical protein
MKYQEVCVMVTKNFRWLYSFFRYLLASMLLLFGCTNEKTIIAPLPDFRPPVIEWISPAGGSTISGTVALVCKAWDDHSIDSLCLFKNGFNFHNFALQAQLDSLYTFQWNTLNDSDGIYSLEIRAWDGSGNISVSPALILRVSNTTPPPPPDRTPPVITWLSPDPGSIVRDTVELRFKATDNISIDSIKIFIDGETAFILAGHSDSLYSVHWNSWGWVNGRRIIELRAWDGSGNFGVGEPVGITLDNHRVLWVPDQYQTIQGAINASRDGDTVRVKPGTYRENIYSWEKCVWLESSNGPEVTIIDASNDWQGIWFDGEQDTTTGIRGFTIIGSQGQGILLEDRASPKVVNNIVLSSGVDNLTAWRNRSIIRNNIMSDSDHNIELWYSYGEVDNNIVIHSHSVAFWNISAADNNPIILDYNLIWDYGQLNAGLRFGQHNIIDRDPLFVIDSFRLATNSPCINSGRPDLQDLDGSISDIGAYGGPFAYPPP